VVLCGPGPGRGSLRRSAGSFPRARSVSPSSDALSISNAVFQVRQPHAIRQADCRWPSIASCLAGPPPTPSRLTTAREFEDDPTNFWFFFEAGLERLLDPAGWDIMATNVTGNGVDDRYFCLTESRVAKSRPTMRLFEGWHKIENGAWRWAKREFAAVPLGRKASPRPAITFTPDPFPSGRPNTMSAFASATRFTRTAASWASLSSSRRSRSLMKRADCGLSSAYAVARFISSARSEPSPSNEALSSRARSRAASTLGKMFSRPSSSESADPSISFAG
jgi:hypothetical protein